MLICEQAEHLPIASLFVTDILNNKWMNTMIFRLQVCCYWSLVYNLTLYILATTLSNVMEERQKSKPDVQLATMKSVSRYRCY